MKHQLITIIVFFSLVFIAFSESGIVVHTEGSAKMRRALKIQPVELGQELQEGDVIITGKGGRVEIEMGDGNDVLIDESSRLVLKTQTTLDTEWDLELGSIRASLNNWESKAFIVRTPAATAGVRGTDFVAEFDPENEDEAFKCLVLEGEVNVDGFDPKTKKKLGNVVLKAKEGVQFRKTGQMKQKIRADENMLNKVRDRFKPRRKPGLRGPGPGNKKPAPGLDRKPPQKMEQKKAPAKKPVKKPAPAKKKPAPKRR